MTSWPEAYDRILLDETDSTMAEAARRATDLARPTWIVARRQTAGRGRRGRAWAMADGNFAATLALRIAGPAAAAAQRSFVAALALLDAFVALTGRDDCFALKWPNDVLLNGGKVAGILLESLGQGGRTDRLAIGFGVNLAGAPDPADLEPGALRPVALAAETGTAIAPEDFLDPLATAYAAREASFAVHGFGPTRNAWLARAARLGQPVTARSAGTETTGSFETVDDTGALVLATATGRRTITAAEVYF